MVLQGDCPEEYESLLDTTRRTANTFLDKVSLAPSHHMLKDNWCVTAWSVFNTRTLVFHKGMFQLTLLKLLKLFLEGTLQLTPPVREA